MPCVSTQTDPIKTKKTTKSLTENQKFKKNCVEEFEEPPVEGWSQVEAEYGGVYARGSVLTKKFRAEHEGENIPKRHFLTLEEAVEFADRLKCSEAITKTTAGYELRVVRCAIRNSNERSFNSGLRLWLRDTPFDDYEGKPYGSVPTGLDAHILVDSVKTAKKVDKHNREQYEAEALSTIERHTAVEVESEDERELASSQDMEDELAGEVVAEEEKSPLLRELESEDERELASTQEMEDELAGEESEEEEEVEVEEVEVNGKTYFKDDNGIWYSDMEGTEIADPTKKKTIKPKRKDTREFGVFTDEAHEFMKRISEFKTIEDFQGEPKKTFGKILKKMGKGKNKLTEEQIDSFGYSWTAKQLVMFDDMMDKKHGTMDDLNLKQQIREAAEELVASDGEPLVMVDGDCFF